MKPWLVVQPQTVLSGDGTKIAAQYSGAQVVADWQPQTDALVSALPVPVAMWRWTQDPRTWSGWPGKYVARCAYAVFWNEPDIEGPEPDWYDDALEMWRGAGGKAIEPAWSNEANRTDDGHVYDAVSAHDYADTFANLTAVRDRAHGLPVLLTEYGHAGHQSQCLVELAAAGVTEPTAIFIWRWEGNTSAGYDVADITLAQPPAPPERKPVSASTYCTEIGPDGSGHNRCGAACIADVLLADGWQSDPWGLTLDVTATALGEPGPASPQETIVGGLTCAQMIALAGQYGKHAQTWSSFDDAFAAIAEGKKVLLLLDNWYLKPRVYPAGSGWDALHWIRLVGQLDDKTVLLHDPLCYVGGEYPGFYQGPTTALLSSVKAAVAATGLVESGIWVE